MIFGGLFKKKREPKTVQEYFKKLERPKGITVTGGGGVSYLSEAPETAPPTKPAIEKKGDAGREVGFLEKNGKQFVLPLSELKKLKERKKVEEKEPGSREFMAKDELEEKEFRAMEERQAELLAVAKETGVFEERPEKTELDIEDEQTAGPLSYVPVTGTMGEAIGESVLRKWFGISDVGPLMQTPEGQRELMKQAIQKEYLENARKDVSILGTTAEALGLNRIPIGIGDAVEKFVKTPSQEVETLRDRLIEIQNRASSMTDAAAQGEIGNPAEVLRELDRADREIVLIESKIKYMLDLSAELKENPEEVNLIEDEILTARNDIFEAKQRAGEGALVTPTSESLYSRMRGL